MYLIDTNVISEARKKNANPGVADFLRHAASAGERTYLPVIVVGELRRGVERLRHRGDLDQAGVLEAWLAVVVEQYEDDILAFDMDAAQVWGRLRVPRPENGIDKQIAAIALVHDLTVVTRNTADFAATGVRVRNPFSG